MLTESVRVRVLAFARLRELLPQTQPEIELRSGARVGDAWALLAQRYPALGELRGSTRVARNGAMASFDDVLADGDELALLPPVGGG